MSLLRAMASYLASKSGVTAKVSTRIYIHHIPQTVTGTALVLSQISSDGTPHQTAAGTLTSARVQVMAVGTTYAEARYAADAARNVLAGYQGGTWGAGADQTTVLRVDEAGEDEFLDQPDTAADRPEYTISLDYYIHYRRTAPTFV